MTVSSFHVRRIQFGPAKNALLLRVYLVDKCRFDCILSDGKLYKHRRGSSFSRTLDRGLLLPEELAFLVAHSINALPAASEALDNGTWLRVWV